MVEISLFGLELDIHPIFFVFYVIMLGLTWLNPYLKEYSVMNRILFSILIIPIIYFITNHYANK